MLGVFLFIQGEYLVGLTIFFLGILHLYSWPVSDKKRDLKKFDIAGIIFIVSWILVKKWLPLGPGIWIGFNYAFVAIILFLILGLFQLVIQLFHSRFVFAGVTKEYARLFPRTGDLVGWGCGRVLFLPFSVGAFDVVRCLLFHGSNFLGRNGMKNGRPHK